jgi:uncharacterized protein DUF6232
MTIEPRSSRRPRCGWAVYYADQQIVVTSWYVETPDGRFPVVELDDVLRFIDHSHPARTVALIVGGVEVVLALPVTVAWHSSAMLCSGFLAALGVACGVMVDSRRQPRWMELHAAYRGEDLKLFCTRDKTAFEKVRRALIRAIEANAAPGR